MTGKTHCIAGLATGLLITGMGLSDSIAPMGQALPLTLAPVVLAGAITGSMFPDIDTHTSKAGRKLPVTSVLIQFFIGHRTLFHSPLLYLVLAAVLVRCVQGAAAYWLILSFLAGAGSHLILDTFNRSGVPLLYPYKKRFHIGSWNMDGFAEHVFRATLCLVVVLEAAGLASYLTAGSFVPSFVMS